MRIICDFDGTITRRDTTDLVLETLADPAWRALEEDWIAGRITAAACMRAQISLIGGSSADLDALLDTVRLAPGFVMFAAWCGDQGLPLSIVSDGVDHFIERILSRYGLAYLPVIANRLVGEAGAWSLEQPWRRDGCAAGSGVCKCAAVGVFANCPRPPETVFIGDGRSDFCVSGRADLLFAKGALADYATARVQPFIRFDTFDDVTRALVARQVVAPAAARVAAL